MPGHDLWKVKIDLSQIDQLLANLTVNARDAIAGVGKVAIETDNVTLNEDYCTDQAGCIPGDYVLLAVSDDGCGMNKETLAKALLERLGYTVLSTRMPTDAIRLAGEYAERIDLLITDVVMPEMNGRELAERLTSIHPLMKCLYMSGYSADLIAHRGVLAQGVHFIQKPFSQKALAQKVREALEEESRMSP